MDKTLFKIYYDISKKYGLTVNQVKDINNSQYKFTKDTIRSIDFKKMNKDNWHEYKTNFIYKLLGKIHVNVERILKINNRKYNGTK